MRRKTINSKLSAVFDNWVESITDPDVQKLAKDNTIITGGCITSMLLGEDVNDYDMYFTNKETTLAIANYYVNKYRRDCDSDITTIDCEVMGDKYQIVGNDPSRVYLLIPSTGVSRYHIGYTDRKNKVKYLPKVFTCNAITLHDDVQLIVRFYGDAKEIHKNFDFIHATCYWTSKDKKVVMPAEALESILNRQLIYRGSRYPLSSVIRTRKFINRGWKITGGEYLKMCFQISELDLTNVEILADQLVGVDTTYFSMIIDIIKKAQLEDSNIVIDGTYVNELVDMMFN